MAAGCDEGRDGIVRRPVVSAEEERGDGKVSK
jgi:hypothetical protein